MNDEKVAIIQAPFNQVSHRASLIKSSELNHGKSPAFSQSSC